jgi:hypothetical protein
MFVSLARPIRKLVYNTCFGRPGVVTGLPGSRGTQITFVPDEPGRIEKPMMLLLTICPTIRGINGIPVLKKAMLTKMTLSRVRSATSETALRRTMRSG